MNDHTDLNKKETLKRFKKIPVHVVEEHNDALQFIYSAIGGKKLPTEGTTLLHLDAHPDMLIDRKLKGREARSGRKLLPLLQIENWIVPAAAAGHLGRVVWLRPPWAKQFTDGTRVIHVGDHPATGLLRIDSKEPYYLSDALYSTKLLNEKAFTFTVAELLDVDEDRINKLALNLGISQPYVLDIDLDFFSTGNPFLNLFEEIGLYDRLETIFSSNLPSVCDVKTLEEYTEIRESELQELENIFVHLEKFGDLSLYKGSNTDIYKKVCDLVKVVTAEANRLGQTPDWWMIYAAGCTRDQGGLPYHISTEEQIETAIKKTLKQFLHNLPPPVLITVARSTDDGYCPSDQVDLIQCLVLETVKDVFETDEPNLHYLNTSNQA
ncbi:UPF0489 protein C5orf22 homolog [Pararge aegeria]|uniref:Jg10758 protein n=2 Tax=Pararge aegeria TaxID=116150 RepID=A0A8S4RH69_9NEOP|nr:UPF0489 protein C5orf22 homolog [Pararge aegeria]CAH2236378.1 jg10758 [Pararge aegeria aegeria]